MAASKQNKKTKSAETLVSSTVLQTPDLKKKELKGNVYQVKQNFYKATVQKNGVIKCKLDGKKYDEHNIIVTYNEQGNRTTELRYGVAGDGDIHIYNDKGKLDEYISLDKTGKRISSSKSTFDKWGHLRSRESYDINNNLTDTTFWIADKMGGVVDYYSVKPDGKKTGRATFINNEKGQHVESKGYNDDGTLKSWTQHKLNEYGHSTETKSLKPDGTVIKIETRNYEYNESGRMIACNGEYYKDKNELETWKIEYDERGNWIRKYQYYRNIPTGIFLREISYYGENKEVFTMDAPLLKNIFILESVDEKIGEIEEDKDDYDSEENKFESTLTPAQIEWVMEGSEPDNFNEYRYYGALFNEIPTEVTIDNDIVEVMALMAELKENMEACLVNCVDTEYGYTDHPRYANYTLCFPDKPYILKVEQIEQEDLDEYDIPDCIKDRIDRSYQIVFTGKVTLLRPSDASGKRDEDFEQDLDYHLQTCMIKQKPEMPEIYMIQVAGGGYALRSHPVNDNFIIKNLDINYGYGFEKFHNSLMSLFQNKSKGLVLFHGEPGTGKTYYIRHLLRKMASNKKIVIYMPPGMVDVLVDPLFMTFLSAQVTHYSNSGNFCVLLIEDAEPLLAARGGSDTRIQGVTNLLNMTDGLLNDMLNLQIICTFNVPLKKLDKALLREGRLIARKEFKAMSPLDANILAQQLGVKHHFTKAATLSEVYSLLKNNSTLIHDVDEEGNNVD